MILRNVGGQTVGFRLLALADGTPFPGAVVTAYRCLDYGAQTPITGTIVDVGHGQYIHRMSAADCNAGTVSFLYTAPGAIFEEKTILPFDALSPPPSLVGPPGPPGPTGPTGPGASIGSALTGGAANSLLYVDAGGNLAQFAPAAAQLVMGGVGGVPSAVTMSGDATITSAGVVALAATAVTAGSYGDGTHYPTFTVDAAGRMTLAGAVAIPGSVVGGTGVINTFAYWTAVGTIAEAAGTTWDDVTAGLTITGPASAATMDTGDAVVHTVIAQDDGAGGHRSFYGHETTHGRTVQLTPSGVAGVANAAAVLSDGTNTLVLCDGVNKILYVAANPAAWAGVPTDLATAVDRLAAFLLLKFPLPPRP